MIPPMPTPLRFGCPARPSHALHHISRTSANESFKQHAVQAPIPRPARFKLDLQKQRQVSDLLLEEENSFELLLSPVHSRKTAWMEYRAGKAQ
ncbi:hypothetical protein SS50377_26639 [Spironucleus salmonicida]|nr:hypothetical protein SS50377_26639 [Spironucleus salmonicida]|eukprot:EST41476.1 Hypothetical protein SS50377_19203 [Spironucleus salmonicida]